MTVCVKIYKIMQKIGVEHMKKTVCELFAGVGGFRCGLNSIKDIKETEKISGKPEKWQTV